MNNIPFNRPFMTGRELLYIREAHRNGMLAGDGPFTERCHAWIEHTTGTRRALMTHSCTAALEMSAILLDLGPEDEVILPSYTFVSTANAFVLRGATPVFVDIRSDTLNLDEEKVQAAITPKTRAIVAVHYAGVACEMNALLRIAEDHGLFLIEDAAQAIMSTYEGRPLGTIGHMGTFSFHETKNIIAGEGGALLVNETSMIERAEIVREKGTDRSKFFRGEVDKYTWRSPGSSFLPGELVSAFLWAQLEEADCITATRKESWSYYHHLLQPLERAGYLTPPRVPTACGHNGHMYFILLNPRADRDYVLRQLKRHGIGAVFHYVPLHDSPGGRQFGRCAGELSVTEDCAQRLIRLPLWVGISREEQRRVVDVLKDTIAGCM